MTSAARLLRNTVLTTGVNLATKAVNVLVFILIARRAGAEPAGIFSLATTYLLIFTALVWGLDDLMVRQVARNREAARQYLGAFLAVRLALVLVLYGGLYLFVARIMGYAPATVAPILIFGLSLIPDSLGLVAQSLMVAYERLEVPFGAAVFASLVKLAGGAAVFMGFGLVTVGWFWVAGSTAGALVLLAAALRLAGRPQLSALRDRAFWQEHARMAGPFLVIGFLLTLEYQLDVVVLSAVRGEAEVGWYSAAVVIAFALTLFSQAFRVAVYPLMARYRQEAPEKLERLYDLAFVYLGAAALPMAAGLSLLSEPILLLVYGPSFRPAVLPLQIIAWSLIFLYLNVPNSRLMLVNEQQGWLSRLLFASMGVNLVLNLALDPFLGATGAAVARLASTLAFFLPNYLYVLRHYRAGQRPFAPLLLPAIATALMAAVVWLARDLALWVSIPLGAGTYLLALLALRGVPADERRLLQEALRQSPLKIK